MLTAISNKDGQYSLQNNIYVDEAYQQQLQMPRSLAELAQMHCDGNQCNNGGERVDDDVHSLSHDVQFDPTEVEDTWDDDDLPIKYVNKMKRYKEMKKMVPLEKPELADSIQYANSMGSQPTAYAELLKICQKHGADKSMYDEITAWAQHHHSKDPNVFHVANRSQRRSRKKLLRFLKQ
jgi:hypothetical protein